MSAQQNDRTGFVLLRGIGFIYCVAFFSLARQVIPLLGHDGLLPADLFLSLVKERVSFYELPTLFWNHCSDVALQAGAWVGFALSVLVLLGISNAILMLALWLLYMSYVHIGQVFYGYGWETMTLEAGFLAIFLCPLSSLRPSNMNPFSSTIILFWYRWMLFRVMFGAGLIKLRGDECWRDLTCLAFHYETQPIPNALSWYLHQMPMWFHQTGCLFNHFVELIVPFFYFAPQPIRRWAGILTIMFQGLLILSGNLSWLNWLTIVIAISCLGEATTPGLGSGRLRKGVIIALSIVLGVLSINPIRNMISPGQKMNASFDPLHLMNTYGAFGSVGKVRHEIVLEGSNDGATWQAYEFLGKPGDPARRPPVIAPYQSRIDWQIWFAAMQQPDQNPWLIHMIYKLLNGDLKIAGLLRHNPFPESPPQFIRAAFYGYRFTTDRKEGLWWRREYKGLWLRPMSADDPALLRYVESMGWLRSEL